MDKKYREKGDIYEFYVLGLYMVKVYFIEMFLSLLYFFVIVFYFKFFSIF